MKNQELNPGMYPIAHTNIPQDLKAEVAVAEFKSLRNRVAGVFGKGRSLKDISLEIEEDCTDHETAHTDLGEQAKNFEKATGEAKGWYRIGIMKHERIVRDTNQKLRPRLRANHP